MLDGEIVVLDQHSRPSFNALQHQVVYYAFDLLHLDGRKMTAEPLELRRAELPALMDGVVLRVSQELPGAAGAVAAVKGCTSRR